MAIKYAVTQWGLPGKGFYAVKEVSKAGFDGLQLELGGYDDGYFLAQRRLQDDYMEDAAKYGIEFPSLVINDLCNYGYLGGEDSAEYAIAMESMELALETAQYMGIGTIMLPQFFANEIKNDEELERAAKIIRRYCKDAASVGINIISESILSAQKQIELVRAIDMPNLSTLYDSENYYFFKGYTQKDVIRELYPYMGNQLHVKDGYGKEADGGVLSGAMLGKGDSCFMDSVSYLKEQSYSGWIIIENYYFIKPLRDINKDQYKTLADDLCHLKGLFGG